MEGDNAVYRGDDPWTTTEFLPMQMVGGAKLVQGQVGNAIRVILHNIFISIQICQVDFSHVWIFIIGLL